MFDRWPISCSSSPARIAGGVAVECALACAAPDRPALGLREIERRDGVARGVRDQDLFARREERIEPFHQSLSMAVPQAAASNSRPDGQIPSAPSARA